MRNAAGRAVGTPGRSARAVGEAERRDWWRRSRLVGLLVALGVLAAAVAVGLARRTGAPGGGSGWTAGGAAAWAAGSVAGLCLAAAWRVRPAADPWRWARGAAGEEATAAILSRVPRRWVVLHDRRVPGRRGNIDHVVIGRRRVWVVDSKAYRGRLRPGWRSVKAGGRRIDTASVARQAEMAADRLGVAVRPVLAVHGVGLRRRRRCRGVAVVPAAELAGALRREDRWAWSRRRGRREVDGLAAHAARVLPEA